ncbi:Uu.00g004270.m01.CDS01 [Anthostomella pinea]|uniref:Uu.00g004270.m01.CDS01 n=1 Tax=Anthostomella pinea TaxID=933095 RepID=A0AAI8VKM3_9PEZI|nr:Uu.00g004270.m01.CDS01 [Anthostomella pinea]
MSSLRLTFLYPHLFRAVRFGESAAQTTKSRYRKPSNQRNPYAASFATSTRARQAVFERHGKAVEPLPVPPDVLNLPEPDKIDARAPSSEAAPPPDKKEAAQEKGPSKDAPAKESGEAADETQMADQSTIIPPRGTGGTGSASPTPQQAAAEARMQTSGPMEAVLHMPPPSATHHPHISTPPYVHHFDSYTLVKQLQNDGYTVEQAITVMKGVRALLAQNLDFAQEGLISKSDVDNETYLFRAACSELSAEVHKNRKAADEQSRQQRTHLQHEVDILSQRMSQDIMTLKDDVKGMFNDRRQNVREEQRHMDSSIQQINLKISVTLNSDSRSEIEGLRWILIRRSVLGIIFMAVLTLGTLRYTTYLGQQRQKEADREKRHAEALKQNAGREDHAPPVDAAEILAAN